MITAAILAGGLGTRLRAIVSDRPKVLVPVGGRRFLAYLLDQLDEAGVQDVVLCTGHLSEQIREAFGERYRRLDLRYSQEDQPLGTAGALRQAAPLIESDPLLVLNGDSYCEVDLQGFLDWHRGNTADVSMVLTEVADAARFGSVECNESGRVVRFGEKSQTGTGWINAGIYLISKRLLTEIPDGVSVSIERECFPAWLGHRFFAYLRGGRLVDIGTPASLEQAQTFFLPGEGTHDRGNTHRRYVVLDRDGTITVERHYVSEASQLELLPGATAALAEFRCLGLGLVMMTNQSAIGRGFFGTVQLDRIHDRLRAMLGDADIALDGIYHCPHTPEENCECRKPKAAMMHRAARDLGFIPQEGFVIGDKACDIELGRAVGATTFLVRTGYGEEMARTGVQADFVVANLAEAAAIIAEMTNGNQTVAAKSRTAFRH